MLRLHTLAVLVLCASAASVLAVTIAPLPTYSPTPVLLEQGLLPLSRTPPSATVRRFVDRVETAVEVLGDLVLGVLGISEDDVKEEGIGFESGGGGLAAWSESSVYVERTNSLHPSRPSSFGPHLSDPLHSLLFPIEAFTSPASSRGCNISQPSRASPTNHTPPVNWVALIERGKCPFSHKVRTAQHLGAQGVVFGDMSAEEGGIGGMGGLLTPWSPDDTSDITIPSAFVSRASYISLLKTWDEEQPPLSPTLQGLVVVLSRDEVFVWPLLDLLLLLLFLPSLLTLLTVVTQRIRILRQQKLDRAPADLVASLPVFTWGGEKPAPPTDEEAEVGEPTESTSLLPRAPAVTRSPFSFLRRYLPHPSPKAPQRPRRMRTFAGSSALTECAICLSEFEKGDQVMQLPCAHVFHKDEIEGWLMGSKRVCPVCRASITPDSAPPSPPLPPTVTPLSVINLPENDEPVASSSATR